MDRKRLWRIKCTNTHTCTNTHRSERGTYNTHPGGSVGSSSARPAPGGTPRSSAPPRCLSFQPGSGWCWTRWTSSRCPAGTPHLERETERGWEDHRMRGRWPRKKKVHSSLFLLPLTETSHDGGRKGKRRGKKKKGEETLEENTRTQRWMEEVSRLTRTKLEEVSDWWRRLFFLQRHCTYRGEDETTEENGIKRE